MKIFKLIFFFLFFLPSAYAQALPKEELIHEEFQYLKDLKERDPAAYKEAIQAKKDRIHQYTQKVKSQGSERFQRFVTRENQTRKKRIESLRKNRAEGFRDYERHRLERVSRLKEKNPEQFQKMMEKHPRINERLQKYRENPVTHNLSRKNSENKPANSGQSQAGLKPSDNRTQIQREKAKNEIQRQNPQLRKEESKFVQRPQRDIRKNTGPQNVQDRRVIQNRPGMKPVNAQNSFVRKPSVQGGQSPRQEIRRPMGQSQQGKMPPPQGPRRRERQ